MSEQKTEPEPTMEEILASIRRIISEDGQPSGDGDGQADEDVLELTQVVGDDGSITDLNTNDANEGAAVGNEREDVATDGNGATDEREDVERAPPPPPSDGIVSHDAAAASTAALASLTTALGARPDRSDETPIGLGGRTLEDLVRELLRPMLKEWLDDNLPKIVERLVKKELERIARRAEDE